MLTTRLHPAPRLRMNGVTRHFTLHAFMTWMKMTSIFHFTAKEDWYVRTYQPQHWALYPVLLRYSKQSICCREPSFRQRKEIVEYLCVCFRPNCFDSARHILE